MSTTHIEFGHIYHDTIFGDEQRRSIDLLRHVCTTLEQSQSSYFTSLLIDDYHGDHPVWTTQELLDEMANAGSPTPHLVAFEKDFVTLGDDIIRTIPQSHLVTERFKKSSKTVLFYRDEITKIALKEFTSHDETSYCVLLSAAWLLCKLGIRDLPPPSEWHLSTHRIQDTDQVLTLLPSEYQTTEDKVWTLLTRLGYGDHLTARVHYRYF